MKLDGVPLIATDGFKFYRQLVRRVFGAACLYGQVIKTRRNDRVVRVERKARFGAAWRWNELGRASEDSRKLNTSYIERSFPKRVLFAVDNLRLDNGDSSWRLDPFISRTGDLKNRS